MARPFSFHEGLLVVSGCVRNGMGKMSGRMDSNNHRVMLGGDGPARGQQFSLFLRNFLKHPRMLGALFPTSRFVVNNLLRKIDWSRAQCIVEYGPGVGNFTTEILKRMSADAALVAFELNKDFFDFLQQKITDKRLHVVQASAEQVDSVLGEIGLPVADYVISGIPFSNFPPAKRDLILRTTHKILRPGGAFLVYQVSGRIAPHLQQVFTRVDRDFEPLNVLPNRLFYCLP